ncbi:polysaccharide deacetylase family protein [Clostridium estertheticum]|uniref:polysaccharide deacetylase family protein n=1 Tax=Clostridium estertheticum TaxID=238834 RepID=UPI0013E938F7|nr:polysaccharide deacetylase family protein [Clostridium estertheticum]MBZ9687741.1 polysaccharide deacetylase family protein [Clostridium estertheticum]
MVSISKRLIKDFQMLSNINKMGKVYEGIYIDEKIKIPYVNKPGIALTFDDGFRIDHWYNYGLGKANDKNIFGYYDVKATFNINAFHEYENRFYNQEEIDHMLELQHNGHEIANHGYKHENALEYTEKYGQARWVEDEVLALNHWMNKQEHSITKEKFKEPVSFVYPFSLYSDSTTNAIVPNYFKICRGDMFQSNLLGLTSFECEGVVPAICIDYINLPHTMFIKFALKLAKKTGKNLIIMCHSILPKEKAWSDYNWSEESAQAGKYRISPKSLFYVINQAKKIDLEFYTLAEIAGVATFIDSNFEREVRKILNLNPKNKWIPINKLINIKKLDLAGKNISNIGGIEYFLELQELNLANNNVSDTRLLSKLKALKKVNLINNNLDVSIISNIDKCVEIMI